MLINVGNCQRLTLGSYPDESGLQGNFKLMDCERGVKCEYIQI